MKNQKDNNSADQNRLLTRSFNYVQNGKVSKRVHLLDHDNPILNSSDMEEKILKENPFAELKTEIDIINGTHSFASSVLTENNDLEFVFNMRADIKQKPQKCNICNKWFSKESTFQIHMKYHNILKKSLNKCSSCGCSDVFFYQQELTEKNSNTPFKCRVCQILF